MSMGRKRRTEHLASRSYLRAEGIGFLECVPVAAPVDMVGDVPVEQALMAPLGRCVGRGADMLLTANERGDLHCIELLRQIEIKR